MRRGKTSMTPTFKCQLPVANDALIAAIRLIKETGKDGSSQVYRNAYNYTCAYQIYPELPLGNCINSGYFPVLSILRFQA